MSRRFNFAPVREAAVADPFDELARLIETDYTPDQLDDVLERCAQTVPQEFRSLAWTIGEVMRADDARDEEALMGTLDS